MQHDRPVLGWREWLALPQLGIVAIKTKVDSGAHSSSLHVESLSEYLQDGKTWLRFVVVTGRRGERPRECTAAAIGQRIVTDSGGHATTRWFIHTEFRLADRDWEADLNLTSRENMRFPMLLGRNALSERFWVDPAASYRLRPACGIAQTPGRLMKIAILSRNAKLYSTKRLVEAARARGHRVRVLDPLRCYICASSREISPCITRGARWWITMR